MTKHWEQSRSISHTISAEAHRRPRLVDRGRDGDGVDSLEDGGGDTRKTSYARWQRRTDCERPAAVSDGTIRDSASTGSFGATGCASAAASGGGDR